ncbi:MAG: hypothetical protein RLZZ344_546 [Pseudomonadota bacterium]|jgi:hypothetical protein
MSTQVFAAGGYRYIPGVSQYSAGVAAEPGHEIHRVVFSQPVALARGFDLLEAHLKSLSRPITAFCACELRSPAPFTEEGFRAFNEIYTGRLKDWGIIREGINPIARSNVCPEISPPSQPSLHAFSYTVPASADASASFVIAGSGEAPEGRATYKEATVALGDLSDSGLRAKMEFVIGEMRRRMQCLGFDWPMVTATQIYTVHDFHRLLAEQFSPTGVLGHGLTWHFNRPPVQHLEYEMDCRAVYHERVLSVA